MQEPRLVGGEVARRGVVTTRDGQQPAQGVKAGGFGMAGDDPIIECAAFDVVRPAFAGVRRWRFVLATTRAVLGARREIRERAQHPIDINVCQPE
jgi:hypothetical protein